MPRKNNTNAKAKLKPKPKADSKGPIPQHLRQKFNAAGNRNNSPFAHSHGFTLAEEARNTASNRRGTRGRDARLRYQPVTFISGGFMDPLKLFEVPEHTVPLTQAKTAASPSPAINDGFLAKPSGTGEPSTPSTGVDQLARPAPVQPLSEPADAESEAASDSSEEVILFKGRNAGRQKQKSPSPEHVVDNNDGSNTSGPRETNLAIQVIEKTVQVAADVDSAPQAEELDFISLEEDRRDRRSHRNRASAMNRGKSPSFRKPHFQKNSDDDDDEAAIIADYIANMQNASDDSDDGGMDDPGLGLHGFSIFRDLGGTDSDAIPSQPSSGDEASDELQHDADEGDTDREKREELTNKYLNRLLAKQDKQGCLDVDDSDADDNMLFGGEDPDEGWLSAPITKPRHKKKGASRKSRMFEAGSQFPSATQMAEAFDAMDLMDIQYSRLQSSKRGPISFGLSDSELENALNVSIKKDRLKKADKKRAREELRARGLLGKNVNPDDLRVKYRGGMSLDDLADEFEAFMLSTREQLILPPFDKGARKIVHSIANSFKIKSKSAGGGIGRYPVLHRSKATLPYDQNMFEQTFSRVRRTWFPRVDVDDEVVKETRILMRTEARDGKSRPGKSSLVLREGEIVGQHAAEIGVENKGRAMLEKMGWSKGMSLGTAETKGIIVPLMHVVKKTKAGLGDI